MSVDSRQWDIYKEGHQLINSNREVIDRELSWIRDWYQPGKPYYHLFKMLGADEFAFD
jgi:hypothetical protein